MKLDEMFRYIRFGAQDISVFVQLASGKKLTPYIGFVGYNNLGDEVLLQAHQKLFPELNFIVYRKESIFIGHMGKLIRRPFCSNAFLGGGTLINRQYHWIDRVEYLLDQGNKVFCIGTGVASPEFWGGDNAIGGAIFSRWVKALNQFEFIGVRGPYSKKALDSAGVKKVKIIGDTALALAEEKVTTRQSKGIVGICYGDVVDKIDNPMWGDSTKYRRELIKAIKSLIASGSKVHLLPIRGEDISSNKSLIKEINHPDFIMIESFDTYANYSDKLRDCDVFIGQKLHSTIIALMNRVPSIMIEYRPKCRDFMASLDLEEYVIKTSEFRAKEFMKMYDHLQKNHIRVKSRAETRILEYKSIQFEQVKKLRLKNLSR